MKKSLLYLFFALFITSVTFAQPSTIRCWKMVSAGKNFTLAVKTDGTLWGWGLNVNQLGLGFAGNQNFPKQVGTANDWMTVSAGDDHALAIKTTGTLWSWGDGTFGQLGNGVFASAAVTPTQVGTATSWTDVSAGTGFSLAMQGISIFSWGRNNLRQLGNNTIIDTNVPGQIAGTIAWLKIDAGHQHSLALSTGGVVFAWGDNTMGQFGNGTNIGSIAPIAVQQTFGNIEISAGFDHSMFLNTNNFLYTAGGNANGQLCNGNNTASNVFGLVTLTSGVATPFVKISAGYEHSMVIDTNFQLYTSGENASGELGLANFSNTNLLTQVGTNANWFQISAGSDHSEAIDINGELWSAGFGLQGQLGVGSNSNSNVVVQVNCPISLANSNFSSADLQLVTSPNPTSGIVKIDFNLQNNSNINFKIVNIQGQLIFEKNIDNAIGLQSQSIDLSSQNSGLYFVTIASDKGSITTKIIKN